MSDSYPGEAGPPHRRRRGLPGRVYVIERRSPVRWLRLRRLTVTDGPALRAHLALLPREAEDGSAEAAAFDAAWEALDLRAATVIAAMAGNTVIAAACVLPGTAGPAVAVTVDPLYAAGGLEAMLASQVHAAAPGTGLPEEAAALASLMLRLGARVVGAAGTG